MRSVHTPARLLLCMAKKYTIGIIGLWHLGEIYSACLADIGHNVIGYDGNAKLVANFRKGKAPLEEPLLKESILRNIKSKRLSFTADISKLKKVDVIWITHDVPVDDEDELDLSIVWNSIKKIVPIMKNGVTIAISSQIPAGTSKEIIEYIHKKRPDLSFGYFYSPENLRLGQGMASFMTQERIIVGALDADSHTRAKALFAPLKKEIIAINPASAEMAKHALNAWLATSISFTNDLADACEYTGADIEDVIRALKTEPRVGKNAYLFAGLGFSGGTLGRDLKALLALTKQKEIHLPLIDGVYAKNKVRSDVVHSRLVKYFGKIKGKTLAIFGVTYKPGTSTLRRSMPLHIEKFLRKQGAILRLADRHAIPHEVATHTPSFFTTDHYDAAQGADIILVLSPDRALKDLDFAKLASCMKHPIIFDAQNVLVEHEAEIRKAGFEYWRVGKR